jgi:hypothetical protein
MADSPSEDFNIEFWTKRDPDVSGTRGDLGGRGHAQFELALAQVLRTALPQGATSN